MNLINTSIFTSSFTDWLCQISINSVIMMIMMFFMLVGAIDKIRGNKHGYGEEFENGFKTLGILALAVAAVIAVAPALSKTLSVVLGPIFSLVGADSSSFAGMLLGADMGGYPLASAMADNEAVGNFNGLIVASIMGPTLVYTIPVALSIIRKEDQPIFTAGVLAGLISVPLGCIVGGFAMNITSCKITFSQLILNTLPVIIIALIIIAGLWFFPDKTIKVFNVIGNIITAVITILTAIAIFQQVTGVMFPLFYVMSVPDETTGLTGLDNGMLVCGQIGIVLAGAFPMVKWLTDAFGNSFKRLGKVLDIDEVACSGFIASLANYIPMLGTLHNMGSKGKLLNIAFAVSAMSVFGDFLGFTAGVNQEMVTPVIIGKLVAGIFAILIANLLAPQLLNKIENNSK